MGGSIAGYLLVERNSWSWQDAFLLGFLGALTTVSSFFCELNDLYYLRGKYGPVYAFR
jgi:fluoride ion exporter CrcB/FEX